MHHILDSRTQFLFFSCFSHNKKQCSAEFTTDTEAYQQPFFQMLICTSTVTDKIGNETTINRTNMWARPREDRTKPISLGQ